MRTQLHPLGVQPLPPIFGPRLLWPNGCIDQDATWYGGSPRPWRLCVRWGPSSPKRGQISQFSTYVYCGQRAGWIKMPLGTKVILSPGHIVLHGDPAPPSPPKKGGAAPNFRPAYCGQTVAHLSNCCALVNDETYKSRPQFFIFL